MKIDDFWNFEKKPENFWSGEAALMLILVRYLGVYDWRRTLGSSLYKKCKSRSPHAPLTQLSRSCCTPHSGQGADGRFAASTVDPTWTWNFSNKCCLM